MSDRPRLPPGQLPNIFDTDPPEMDPATIIDLVNGRVYVDEVIVTEEILEEGQQ